MPPAKELETLPPQVTTWPVLGFLRTVKGVVQALSRMAPTVVSKAGTIRKLAIGQTLSDLAQARPSLLRGGLSERYRGDGGRRGRTIWSELNGHLAICALLDAALDIYWDKSGAFKKISR